MDTLTPAETFLTILWENIAERTWSELTDIIHGANLFAILSSDKTASKILESAWEQAIARHAMEKQ